MVPDVALTEKVQKRFCRYALDVNWKMKESVWIERVWDISRPWTESGRLGGEEESRRNTDVCVACK